MLLEAKLRQQRFVALVPLIRFYSLRYFALVLIRFQIIISTCVYENTLKHTKQKVPYRALSKTYLIDDGEEQENALRHAIVNQTRFVLKDKVCTKRKINDSTTPLMMKIMIGHYENSDKAIKRKWRESLVIYVKISQ